MKQKGKILVIEDEKSWTDLLKEFLTDAGYYVDVADNLDTALKKLDTEMYHFITIDLRLKEQTSIASDFEGWDILEMIKKLRIKDITPTMVITAYEIEYQKLSKLRKLEAVFVMSKSQFDMNVLIQTIDRVVDRIDLRFNNDHRN